MLLLSLDGKEVQYVTRRDSLEYGETIIGREGIINVYDNELIIVCGNEIVFRHPLEGLEGAELLSLDGINLRYKEADSDEVKTIVAYYKYYRK